MAGFGESLGWANNPIYKAFDSNRSALVSGFAGLGGASPRNVGGGFAQGFAQGMPMDMHRADRAAEQVSQNATMEWIKANYPQYATLPVEQAADLAFKTEAAKKAGISSPPANVQEWEYYSQLPPDQQSQYLTMKRSNSPLNIGTGFVTQDMANPGQILGGPIAIENEQAAFDTQLGAGLGKQEAENITTAESVASKMPGLRSVVDTLTSLADTATYTQSGQAMDAVKRELGLPVGQGAIDRASYIAIVDNQVLPLLRDTFGAAFTQKEGESLRATLGDPNKSPEEKKAILNAFIAQKERSVTEFQSRAAAGQGSGEIDSILSGYGL